MVSFFQRRGEILFGLGTKNALIGTQEFLNVPFWDMHMVPSSSLTKSQPRWKLMGPAPLSLNWYQLKIGS